jgi:hypothetical protein
MYKSGPKEEPSRLSTDHELPKLRSIRVPRHPGVSDAVCEALSEAAEVCLARHHEPPHTSLRVTCIGKDSIKLVRWSTPDETAKRSWRNRDDATRDGAFNGILGNSNNGVRSLMAIPYPGTDFTRYKLFPPCKLRKDDTKPRKYHQAPGSPLVLYRPASFGSLVNADLWYRMRMLSLQEGKAAGRLLDMAMQDYLSQHGTKS